MSAKVLVTFATNYGSTEEIAGTIAQVLRARGLAADLEPARNSRRLDGYGAVVLGAPFYMFQWHKEARSFLSRNRKALATLPVAIFALGPFNDDEKEWQGVRQQLAKELTKYPWLSPAAAEVFGGKFDPAKLRFPYNLIPALKKLPASDIRDWTAIRAWADMLAKKFQQPV